jgi:hypothetical protein
MNGPEKPPSSRHGRRSKHCIRFDLHRFILSTLITVLPNTVLIFIRMAYYPGKVTFRNHTSICQRSHYTLNGRSVVLQPICPRTWYPRSPLLWRNIHGLPTSRLILTKIKTSQKYAEEVYIKPHGILLPVLSVPAGLPKIILVPFSYCIKIWFKVIASRL